MSDKWHSHVARLQSQIVELKGQIAELKETLGLIEGSVGEQHDLLEQRTKDLRASLENKDGEGKPQYQLPPVLRILNNPDVGALLIGQDGRYLLFNAMAERLLGSALKGKDSPARKEGHGIYGVDKTTRCEESELPWQQCAAGKSTQEVVLFVRRGDADGLWIRTISVPVHDEQGSPNGAIAFLLDTTEHVVVEEQVNSVLRALQGHLEAIERSHDLMLQLIGKLSIQRVKMVDRIEKPVVVEVTSDFSPARSPADPIVDSIKAAIVDADKQPAMPAPEPIEKTVSQSEDPVAVPVPSQEVSEVLTEEPQAAVVEQTEEKAVEPQAQALNADIMTSSGEFTSINRRNRQLTNRVLVVDDISVNQKLLKLQMRRLGFDVETASNGKEAVDLVVQNDYDMVLMDLDMPIMDGPTATAAIREIEAVTLKYVPIVAVTSYERDIDRQKCAKAGMDDYLVKGASRQQLIDVINKYVNKVIAVEDAIEMTAMSAPEVSEAPADLSASQNLPGSEELQEVFRLFYSSVNTFVECLQLAIDEKKADAVTHFAHCIKGPAASLGLTQLTIILVKMIDAAEAENWTQVAYQYRNLKSNYNQALGRLKDMYGSGQLVAVAG